MLCYCTGGYRPGLARRFFGHGPLSSEGQTRLGFDCLEVGEDRLGLLLDCGQAACGCRQVLGARRWGRRKLERIGLDLLIGLGRLRSEGQIRLVRDCRKDRQVLGARVDGGARKLDRRLRPRAALRPPARPAPARLIALPRAARRNRRDCPGRALLQAPERGTAMQLSRRGVGAARCAAPTRPPSPPPVRSAAARAPARPPAVGGIRLRNRTRSSAPRPTGLPAPGPRLPARRSRARSAPFPAAHRCPSVLRARPQAAPRSAGRAR